MQFDGLQRGGMPDAGQHGGAGAPDVRGHRQRYARRYHAVELADVQVLTAFMRAFADRLS